MLTDRHRQKGLLSTLSISLSENTLTIELPDWLPILKIRSKIMTSNPLFQFALSNPKLQTTTHFLVDMFPYRKAESFHQLSLLAQLPKKPGDMLLFGT